MTPVKINLRSIGAVEVDAHIVGALAVHRHTNDGESFDGNRWMVSHIPTGAGVNSLAAVDCRKPEKLKRWARAIQDAAPAAWSEINALPWGADTVPNQPARVIIDAARTLS